MKDVTQLLREKEQQAERLTKEIKVLRVAAQILNEEERAAEVSGKANVASAPRS